MTSFTTVLSKTMEKKREKKTNTHNNSQKLQQISLKDKSL